MACGAKSKRVRFPVFSDGTTTAQFFPFIRMSVADATDARLSVVLESSTGLLTVETAARYGDDESDLPGATPVDFPSNGSPTTRTSNGDAFATNYRPLDVSKQVVELGLKVKNTSGTAREMGVVTLIIDLKT